MAISSFSRFARGMNNDQLINALNEFLDEVEHRINGRLDSKNIQEIAGFIVNLTELLHKSGLVGMSGADPHNPEAVRIWAGSEIKEEAPFQVPQNGYMKAIGALLRSVASGYPAVEINSTSNLLAAYAAEDNYVSITPSNLGNPALVLTNGGSSSFIQNDGDDLFISTPLTGPLGIDINSGNDLRLRAQNGKVRLDSWSELYSALELKTLREELDTINSRLAALEARPIYVPPSS